MKLMLFGDSHLASIKAAANHIPAPKGFDVHYWGTAVAVFRRLCWRDGAIQPTDEFARRNFAAYSGGLTKVVPDDYDAIVFVSTRIRLSGLLPDVLAVTTDPDRHVTDAYIKRVIEERMSGYLTFPFAKRIGAAGKPKIWLSLSPLDSDGRVPVLPQHRKHALKAKHQDVEHFFHLVEEVLAKYNIGFIAQPIETVVNGYFTDPKYSHPGQSDYLHKNTAYGKLMLTKIYEAVEKGMQS